MSCLCSGADCTGKSVFSSKKSVTQIFFRCTILLFPQKYMQGIAGRFQNFLSSFSYKAFAVFEQNLYKNCKGSTTPQGRSISSPPLDGLFITLWNWHSSFLKHYCMVGIFIKKSFTCTVHSRIINMTQLETMNTCTIPCVVCNTVKPISMLSPLSLYCRLSAPLLTVNCRDRRGSELSNFYLPRQRSR